MTKAADSFSVDQIRKINPALGRSIDRHFVQTYDEFVEYLHADIDDALQALEMNPELRQGDAEDRLTIDLVNFLRARSYHASHEPKVGGHVDILVQSLTHGFNWLGEAKIHSSYPIIFKGFQQLCSRYLPGTPNSNRGGLITYVFGKNCAGVISEWKAALPTFLDQPISVSPCHSPRAPLSFISTHEHSGSGLPIVVRHMGVMLHFSPQDREVTKSARKPRKLKASPGKALTAKPTKA